MRGGLKGEESSRHVSRPLRVNRVSHKHKRKQRKNKLYHSVFHSGNYVPGLFDGFYLRDYDASASIQGIPDACVCVTWNSVGFQHLGSWSYTWTNAYLTKAIDFPSLINWTSCTIWVIISTPMAACSQSIHTTSKPNCEATLGMATEGRPQK